MTLAEDLIAEAARLAGKEWDALREGLEPRLLLLAADVERAARAMAAGQMTAEQAKGLLQLQRLALGSILRHGKVLAAVRLDLVVDGLVAVAGGRLLAATGVDQRL